MDDRVGETVVLWIKEGDGLAMAAARDGVQPLRYVARLGLRLSASGWASRTLDGIVEGELEPGVWMLAISLDDRALLAVVGPHSRLRGAAGAEARRALKQAAGDERAWAGSGPISPSELDAFLSQALVASLSYLSDGGDPARFPPSVSLVCPPFRLFPSPLAQYA